MGILENPGFEMIEDAHADAAIARLGDRDDIDAAFTDIEMPGSRDGITDGIELAHTVCEWRRPVKIVAASGSEGPTEGGPPHHAFCLRMPYHPDNVIVALRRAA